ncbi:ADP-ribose pyrophosphatase [bacterium (Candidatus Blackallbacteria) CG17_big_fil_post_rev_8_21_14_2_50_48_46]|uniref:ADP-ribose pyrophosphatase n=1 Tax=bacterium (Candidatus Blackallbacteria) CG17_big_fil_post_rev_8_21_14_2_50_48_46 TaxID=2014261 RepID=A0A2M7G3D6_9BACT|nr:MAG: ADP-ribose pyrophosphatase [bacterium (Candidatus Blackallbacteria) CG18_big_fil_WC_8_21_14_2_50_49_26]PIW16348.1 MAG: ADP-ribose pyrophosphatase [bacterium (Candidatus Blackallbacteria) CG17_big_fil_post_rev_8_21_14_2_50_48_46]PIW45362.1 MAG: ADP-ribose pyrophosphatase [bacterium (Candidatus Blackallbacteria) CG13_big_fil_rev_8_21_14_2_50_49_14]
MAASLYPEVTVGALILNPQGEIFFFKTHKWKDHYAIPGGHIELGEDAESAIRREVFEETHLPVTETLFLCYQEALFDPAFWESKHFVFLDFICHTPGGEVILNDEAESWLWAKPEEALQLDLEPYTRKTLLVYLEKTAYQAL